MKIHNLICRSNIVLETNDDMFPGLGASVFDEKKSKEDDAQAALKLTDAEWEIVKAALL